MLFPAGTRTISKPTSVPGMESRTMVWAFALALTAIAAHASAQERREFRELHMGMEVRVVLFESDEAKARMAARAAFDRIAQLEDVMSDYRPDSELRRLQRRPREWIPVSAPLFAVLARAIEVAAATNGAFDPTVGPFVQLWREARRAKRLPDARALDSARALVGWRRVALDSALRRVRLEAPDMHLDLGGIAKGYILERAVAELRERGVPRSMIVAGGDIAMGDGPPGQEGWTILTQQDSTIHTLHDACFSSSGSDFQFVEIGGVRYSHVVDPRTGLGLTNDLGASVIASDCTLADAVATALTVLGPSGLQIVRDRYPAGNAHVIKRPDFSARSRPR
jgi:FAD:protein FMN transferase